MAKFATTLRTDAAQPPRMHPRNSQRVRLRSPCFAAASEHPHDRGDCETGDRQNRYVRQRHNGERRTRDFLPDRMLVFVNRFFDLFGHWLFAAHEMLPLSGLKFSAAGQPTASNEGLTQMTRHRVSCSAQSEVGTVRFRYGETLACGLHPLQLHRPVSVNRFPYAKRQGNQSWPLQ